MRGRLAFLLGGAAVAGATVYRFLRPGRAAVAEPVVEDRRADELRAKLAESREVVAEREEFEAAETPVDVAAEVAPEPADRRRAVHERGRKVAEQMRRPGSTSAE
jgi:hypothetical protein